MEYFLERIARLLVDESGDKLNRHCLVFPGRRAGLYMVKYLSQIIDKPVWSPSIVTINDLFSDQSSLQIAANELLLFELYKQYRTLNIKAESFDEFYFWGDMILNDFDDVDKYLVDPSGLFQNVLDYKKIDQEFGGLTPEQIEIISRFWINFNPSVSTREKDSFIALWSVLKELYYKFREALREQNLAYEGMLFRDLAESGFVSLNSQAGFDMYHFIGFNALNRCERELMTFLKKTGKARFYWDYDASFLAGDRQNSAGLFMGENLRLFGDDMPPDWSHNTLLSGTGIKRRVINTASDVSQVKLVPQLISQLPGITAENAHHTAIVLGDENLLMPMMTSLPEDAGAINITMGYPLKHTMLYILIRQLADLQRSSATRSDNPGFGYIEVINILKHSIVSELMTPAERKLPADIVNRNLVRVPAELFNGSELLSAIFRKAGSPDELSSYIKNILTLVASGWADLPGDADDVNGSGRRSIYNEFIYRIVLSLNRLEALMSGSNIPFSTETYFRILDRLLRVQSVPFSGEPLMGIQIMGILETRALDFTNLVVLSVNEGVLPAVSPVSSFIPYSLREAFGLPSVSHQESVFAYHFYRLLQRAENVTFVYNSNSDGLRSGEMSRFLLQMKYELPDPPPVLDIGYTINIPSKISDTVERTAEHQQQLLNRYILNAKSAILSPSAINTWLGCRMRFYYRYINNLREPESVTADIDPALFGSILHLAIKMLYNGFRGSVINRDVFGSILNDRNRISMVTDEAARHVLKNNEDLASGGIGIIARDVLVVYLQRILSADMAVAPVFVKELEEYFHFTVEADTGTEKLKIEVGGQIDRIDSINETDRIVDYKTGSVSESVNALEDLFADDRRKDDDAWLQTLVYCEAWLSTRPSSRVRPSVYKIRNMIGSSTEDRLMIRSYPGKGSHLDDYSEIRAEFTSLLKSTVNTIFSVNEPFIMTTGSNRKCPWCPYRKLCFR